jgi:hypothetical protein
MRSLPNGRAGDRVVGAISVLVQPTSQMLMTGRNRRTARPQAAHERRRRAKACGDEHGAHDDHAVGRASARGVHH